MKTIKELQIEIHQNAVEKGFWADESAFLNYSKGVVSGSVSEDKQIKLSYVVSRKLMLIITELSEALSALVSNKRAQPLITTLLQHEWRGYKTIQDHWKSKEAEAVERFEQNVKDTLEDELADVCIRVLDLIEWTGALVYREDLTIERMADSVLPATPIKHLIDDCLVVVGKSFENYRKSLFLEGFASDLGILIPIIARTCKYNGIDLEKHILLKMAYNKTRPPKHNKNF